MECSGASVVQLQYRGRRQTRLLFLSQFNHAPLVHFCPFTIGWLHPFEADYILNETSQRRSQTDRDKGVVWCVLVRLVCLVCYSAMPYRAERSERVVLAQLPVQSALIIPPVGVQPRISSNTHPFTVISRLQGCKAASSSVHLSPISPMTAADPRRD